MKTLGRRDGDETLETKLVKELALAFSTLREKADNPELRSFLIQFVSSFRDVPGRGISVSDAAQLLGVSEPTVRKWLELGTLNPLAEARPAQVSLASLAKVLAAVEFLRREGYVGRLQRAIEALEDQHLLKSLEDRIDELKRGDVEMTHSDDLDDMFD